MKKALTSIWFIALVLTIPVILFLPPFFSKYVIKKEFTRSNINPGYSVIHYFDLSGDGEKEIIEGFEYFQDKGSIHSIQYFAHDGRIYDQINFEGNYHSRIRNLFFADVNQNNLAEIYAFTLKSDSLLLNVVEPFGSLNKNYFVCKTARSPKNVFDLLINFGFFQKIPGYKNTQFVFSLEQGFSIRPKRIFIFDLESGQINHTPIVGNNNTNIQFFQNPETNNWEIIADGNAGNIIKESEHIYLKDDRPYLKIYDENLIFKIDPVPFPKGITAATKTFPITENGKTFYLTFYNSRGALSPNPTVYKISEKGEIIDSLKIDIKQQTRESMFFKFANDFIVYCERGIIRKINSNLEITEKFKLKNNGNLVFSQNVDINEDGIPEFLCFDLDKQNLILFTDKFKREYFVDEAVGIPSYISSKIKKNQFYAYNNNITYNYSFRLNPYRFLSVPLFVAIYLFLVLLVWSIQKIQETRLKQKYELQKKVRELQLATFRNQLNPHFVFNTFNSIVSVALHGKKEEAHNLFFQFSTVLRKSLKNTESVLVPLIDELSLVTNFVAIQQFRFKNLFEFELNMDPEIDKSTTMIPKMIIQIHVENAIKHGLKPKRKNGKLIVNISKTERSKFRIEITDNGIGRKKASEIGTGGTNLGLKTMDEFIKEINHSQKIKVQQEITDKKDNFGNVAGTRVIIEIENRK